MPLQLFQSWGHNYTNRLPDNQFIYYIANSGECLTLSLPMSPFCDQRQSANVAYMRLGHVVCFSDVYYPILRHIVANKGDNLNRRPVFGKQTRKWQKKSQKNVNFSF